MGGYSISAVLFKYRREMLGLQLRALGLKKA
jgi:hypothetical protein